ncbi:hypothetical protein A3Q56_08163 [Intoshia linei]|uniref:Ubiquitin carboxyl-terminal hydrolase n=1 Tax=Intoshia linei TaxID=1819745 RepID=A0A177ARI8_9BILA|nr:hypothetical protein A3Q56_08163 [Intoshia linei]
MAKKPAEWCLMESDPGVFTELLKNFGVEGLQIDEPWELSYQWFEQTKYVYGIILLFKMDSNELVHGEYDKVRKDIYFSKQIAPNSCATIALLNIVMNIDCEEIEKGKIVNNIMDFTKEFTSHDRGATIAEADDIKKIHNSFSSDIFLHIDVDKEDYEDGDDFHFVGFIPIGGYLYELDGLKPYPINHGKIPDGEIWTNKATDVLKKRMERLHFYYFCYS